MRHHHLARLLLEANVTVPTRSENRTSSLHNGESSYINMVMILAAFLFALLSALGFNTIVRCASQCGRRFASEASVEVAARLASQGTKRNELQQIPEIIYKTTGLNIQVTECVICLGEFIEGEILRILPRCSHGFHMKCIDTWLVSHSSCPTCRQLVVELPSRHKENLNAMEPADNGIV